MRYIIDRFEGDFAVCETEGRAMVDIPRTVLPQDCAEGDALEESGGVWQKVDNSADKARIAQKLRNLFRE